MQKTERFPSTLCYLINLALVITHQVDSAYQKEWELLHVPGGIRFFMLFTFVAILPLFCGLVQVASGSSSARLFSGLLAATGGLVIAIHGPFLALGYPQFRDPSSLINLTLIFGFSITQLVLLRAPR